MATNLVPPTSPPTNPEKEQSRVHEPAELFDKYGYVMFPQQQRIYREIARRIPKDAFVLEAGAGNGIGTAMLHEYSAARVVVGSDKLEDNVRFAKGLYPWLRFDQWDITGPTDWRVEVVVAVEVIEHVADVRAALKNLLAAATTEVWISTPNGLGKPRPPENPYHVMEYTIAEMIDMIFEVTDRPGTRGRVMVKVLGWEKFEPAQLDADPLVYHIEFDK